MIGWSPYADRHQNLKFLCTPFYEERRPPGIAITIGFQGKIAISKLLVYLINSNVIKINSLSLCLGLNQPSPGKHVSPVRSNYGCLSRRRDKISLYSKSLLALVALPEDAPSTEELGRWKSRLLEGSQGRVSSFVLAHAREFWFVIQCTLVVMIWSSRKFCLHRSDLMELNISIPIATTITLWVDR